MKKLGKNNTAEANTIQAYSCACSCSCTCFFKKDLVSGMGVTISVGNDVKTLSMLN